MADYSGLIESYQIFINTPNAAITRRIRIYGSDFGAGDLLFSGEGSPENKAYQHELSDAPEGDLSEEMTGYFYEVELPISDYDVIVAMFRNESAVHFEYLESSNMATFRTDAINLNWNDEEAC